MWKVRPKSNVCPWSNWKTVWTGYLIHYFLSKSEKIKKKFENLMALAFQLKKQGALISGRAYKRGGGGGVAYNRHFTVSYLRANWTPTSVTVDVKSSVNVHSLLGMSQRCSKFLLNDVIVPLKGQTLLFATHFHPGSAVKNVIIITGQLDHKNTSKLSPITKSSWYRPKLPILSNTWSTVTAIPKNGIVNNQSLLFTWAL